MAIEFQTEGRIFTIQTDATTYQMQADTYGHLLHLYYGETAAGSMEYLLTFEDRGFSGNPWEAGEDRTYSLDALPQEYPTQGTGDFRSPAMAVQDAAGVWGCHLRYQSHSIRKGKYSLPGLPAVYAEEEEAETLEIQMEDPDTGLAVTLYYGVLPRLDVITRAVKAENRGNGPLFLEKAQSACLDFLAGTYDLIQFYGRHAMERQFQRSALGHGAAVIGSRRGTSSHQYSPFVILAEPDTSENHGLCWGLSFVYSGPFKAEAEKDQYGQTRISMGIQDEMFSYCLKPGEAFYAPEVIMSCSGQGLGRLSRNFHKTIRHHICRGRWKLTPRPVLINNWEATYFGFTGSRILEIARQAAELGVEMMVLDDGWFGKRDSDCSGLGDWQVNEEKLGCSLAQLSEQIHGLGLQFGLWVEPEMVSEDSDLYRKHPDWALAVPGRKPVRSRCQLVLDFSREDVVDYIYEQISRVLRSARIEYIKWDMNRSIAEVYSAAADRQNPGEILYRYVLGLYRFLERLNREYPELLIEGCSGGGGRFDAGMLYYTPQIWCSDNTDAMDRIRIQYGTSFGYPISAVGSHISAVPNHQNGRMTPMETRGLAAMAGSFGLELDLDKITEEEKACVRRQICQYHQDWNLIHNGDYYRLAAPEEGSELAAWMFAAADGSEALAAAAALDVHGNAPASLIRLKGLRAESEYRDEEGRIYSGSGLMRAGIPLPRFREPYGSWRLRLWEVNHDENK